MITDHPKKIADEVVKVPEMLTKKRSLTGFEQSADSTKVMEFGTNTGMIGEPDLELYEVLDRMYGWE